jgi:hypothetical protein
MATRKMFDDDDTGDYTGGDGGQMASSSGQGQNEGHTHQEEEYKGTVDFDKVPLQEKSFIPTIYDDENYEFKVVKPQLHGSHIVYNVQGVDKQGPFEGVRRYNHFYCLYEALQKRWPGVLIPKLPSKKAIGNKEVKFIYERKFYLERFLRKCARFEFIVNSEEFRIFARPGSGDLEKMLDRLPRIPTGTMIERFREVTGVNERNYDFADKERLNQVVAEFTIFAKKVLIQMKAMKKSLSSFRDVRMQSIANNRVLLNLLDKYEDLNINCYTDNNADKLVLNNTEQKQLKE